MKSELERERKFRVSAGFELPQLGERTAESVLRSTYFDTAGFRLLAARVTLRHRQASGLGADGAWQLKLPDGADRTELEVRASSQLVPGELTDLLTAIVRGRGLSPAATLITRRQTMLVKAAGVVVAEVVHDDVECDGHDVFSEVEVELRKAGTNEDLQRISEQLRVAGAREAEPIPKLARALQLEIPPQPAKDEHLIEPAEQLRGALREQFRELIEHDPGTRLGKDPEQLHDMRVAVRRLRAFLRTGRPALDRTGTDRLRGELKWLGGKLGAVRDIDVLTAHVQEQTAALPDSAKPAADTLARMLHERRPAAQEALLQALRSSRYSDLLEQIERTTNGQISDPGPLLTRARREHRKLARAVHALEKNPADAALHQIRIKAKHARYAAELASHAPDGPDLAHYIKRATELQDLLGSHQDAVVAEPLITDTGLAADEPTTTLAAGRLAQIQTTRRAAARADFRQTWRKLRRKHKALRTP